MLHWLVENSAVFKIQHNAHREFRMTVDQHLSHRRRIGSDPLFLNAADREACLTRNILWELQVVLPDGALLDIAGSTLANCIHAAKAATVRSETHQAA